MTKEKKKIFDELLTHKNDFINQPIADDDDLKSALETELPFSFDEKPDDDLFEDIDQTNTFTCDNCFMIFDNGGRTKHKGLNLCGDCALLLT